MRSTATAIVSDRFNQFKIKCRITTNGHTYIRRASNFVMSSKGSVEHVAKGKDLKVGEYLYSLNVYDGHGGSYELGTLWGILETVALLETLCCFSLSEAKEGWSFSTPKDFAESEFGARIISSMKAPS